MADLPTNYLDDILAQSMNGKRKYRITRADGTFEEVTLEDVSEYEQVGSNFGAGDINKTNQEVNELFQSVSNGKSLIASAITDKKVPTDATATFAEMAENISGLKLGSGNAVPSDVKAGKTFTNSDGVEYTGTYDFVSETSGTATASQLKSGQTAWVNGKKITGTATLAATQLKGTVTQKLHGENQPSATNNVVFSTPFASAPLVTYVNTSNSALISHFGITISNITKAGFTWKMTCNLGTWNDGSFTWTATAK